MELTAHGSVGGEGKKERLEERNKTTKKEVAMATTSRKIPTVCAVYGQRRATATATTTTAARTASEAPKYRDDHIWNRPVWVQPV